ncbi:hypothetical protein CP8484711_0505B, partial [Chlamydia psittaci 84-8471/1]
FQYKYYVRWRPL